MLSWRASQFMKEIWAWLSQAGDWSKRLFKTCWGQQDVMTKWMFWGWVTPRFIGVFSTEGGKVWDLELDSALTCMIYTCVYTHYIYNIYVCVCVCVCSVSRLAVSGSLWPHGLYPARLLCPWNSPVKNTGVGSHFLLQGNLPYPGIKPCLDSVLRPFLEAGQFIVLSNWL